ncbi:MAG: hypothetical protein GYA02_18760, partial [Clostridiaceae bacterium]|nr:hypothetical protein [Clostridiaceae bacterium]
KKSNGDFSEYNSQIIRREGKIAEVLKQKSKPYNVSVDVSSFEEWEPEYFFKTSFIFSATAFHWIDYNVRYKKCHDLLKEKGYLVLLWNIAPEIKIPAVKKAYDLLWEYYPEKRKAQNDNVDIKNQRKLEIINSGYFTLEDYLDYKWNLTQTREKFTKGFFSQSSFLSLEKEKQKSLSVKIVELFRGLDEVIETDFYTTVYITRKK